VLSTDDPAMFHTTLEAEYLNVAQMGLGETELAQLVNMSFEHAFLPENDKLSFRKGRNS
jgi:adenosine deaminase